MSAMTSESTKSKKKHSIATKFAIAATVLLVVSFLSQGLLNANYVKSQTTALYNEYTNSILHSSSASISYWLEGAIDNAKVFAQSETFINNDFNYLANYLVEYKDVFNDIFDYAGIVDLNGLMKTSNGTSARVIDRDYFQLILTAQKDFAIDDPVKARTSDKIVFHIAVPVKDKNGNLKQVFVAILEANTIQKEIVDQIKIGDEGFAFVATSTGERMDNIVNNINSDTIAQGNDVKNTVGLKEIITQMKAHKTGSGIVYDKLTGKKSEISYMPVEYTNWSLGIAVPLNQVNETSNGVFKFIGILNIISVILLNAVFISLILVLIKPLRKVKGAISEIASGDADLTKTIDVKSHDEIGDVVDNFNTFTTKLRSIMTELKGSKDNLVTAGEDLEASAEDTSSSITQIIANIDSVHNQIQNQAASVTETASAVNEIASNIDSLEKMIETQSTGVTQASAAIEQMMGNIGSVKNSMDKMAASFDELTEKAQAGSNLQSNVNDQIERIRSQSEALQDANQAIADIAEQTNLLAMNAAIEAAHAGDAGKGFSVVADEIRKLSETSADQSRTIGEQLNEIQNLIQTVVNVSTESSNAFQTVAGKITETDEIVRQIKIALDEQTEGSKQINDALLSMNNSTSEVRNASIEMSSGNKSILEEVQRLQDATTNMKDSMDEMSVGARKINESGVVLQSISKTIKQSIDEMGNQVDKFKV